MPQYQVRDEQTGKTVTFEWHGQGEPTEADMAEVFAEAEQSAPKDFSQFGPMQGLIENQANRETLQAQAKEHAPMIGAGIATAATGGAGLIPSALAAAGGGFIGARLRGDDRGSAAASGAVQGGLQAAGGGVAKLLGAVARPLYRAAIPKHIQDKFSQANLAKQGLESRTVLGTKRGTATAAGANAQAAHGVEAMADRAPTLTAQDVQSAFKPRYNRALLAGKTDKAKEIGEHVGKSMDEIGNQPMSGKAQLARKAELEPESGAAMRAPNANMAATNPQLANIERKAITKNLRRSPEMAKALDKSQAAVGVQRAAKATENSSAVNRLAHGGVWNAMRSPAGISGTAIGINELSTLPFAQLVRLAQLAQLQGQE